MKSPDTQPHNKPDSRYNWQRWLKLALGLAVLGVIVMLTMFQAIPAELGAGIATVIIGGGAYMNRKSIKAAMRRVHVPAALKPSTWFAKKSQEDLPVYGPQNKPEFWVPPCPKISDEKRRALKANLQSFWYAPKVQRRENLKPMIDRCVNMSLEDCELAYKYHAYWLVLGFEYCPMMYGDALTHVYREAKKRLHPDRWQQASDEMKAQKARQYEILNDSYHRINNPEEITPLGLLPHGWYDDSIVEDMDGSYVTVIEGSKRHWRRFHEKHQQVLTMQAKYDREYEEQKPTEERRVNELKQENAQLKLKLAELRSELKQLKAKKELRRLVQQLEKQGINWKAPEAVSHQVQLDRLLEQLPTIAPGFAAASLGESSDDGGNSSDSDVALSPTASPKQSIRQAIANL